MSAAVLSPEEKKEDPPIHVDVDNDKFMSAHHDNTAPPPPSNLNVSPSKRRAKAASSAGLSELSKQLRILQAKNESQSVEINRLERQLRILAELQGISVADLRKALEDACADEAFGELQHRVAKLRAELEAATLAKQKQQAMGGRMGTDASSAPHIANLELRVGELEEVEEKHQTEIHHLYEQLRHERERATRLEAEGAQHKHDAQEYLDKLNKERVRATRLESSFQDQLQKHQLEQSRKMQELAKIAKEAGQQVNRNNQAKGCGIGNGIDSVAGDNADTHGVVRGGNGAGTDASNGTNGGDRNGSSGSQAGDAALSSIGHFGTDGQGGATDPFASLTSDVMGQGIGGAGYIDSGPVAVSGVTPEMAEEYELMVRLLKEKEDELRAAKAALKAEQDKWMNKMRENDGQARQALMNMQVDKDKMALIIKELKDADSQNELRLAQFKARFTVQDERITDVEQQLRSLYTAFGLIKEEQDVEDLKRAALECNLNEADEEMAKQVEDVEKKKSQSQSQYNMSSTPGRDEGSAQQNGIVDPWDSAARRKGAVGINMSPRVSTPGVPRTITAPQTASYTLAQTPGMTSPTASARAMATPSATAQPYTTPERSPSTWQLIFPEPRTTSTRSYASTGSPGQHGLLIKGMLIVKSKSVMRKWKSKHSKLYLQGNHYQWDMEGKSYTLGFGISKLEFYPNHPLSFTVYTNPFDDMAPVVHAATSTEEDYHRWMSALTKATTGGDHHIAPNDVSPRRLEATPSQRSSFHYSSADSIMSGLSAEEQEAADIERALRLSQNIA